MTPEINALNRALARVGEDVVLRRVVSGSNVDVTCRARVRSPTTQEVAAGYQQADSLVILSPTQIAQAGWPGDGSMIRGGGASGDKIKIQGRFRNIERSNPIFVAGALVRYELRVIG
jgi:hypothetical protein